MMVFYLFSVLKTNKTCINPTLGLTDLQQKSVAMEVQESSDNQLPEIRQKNTKVTHPVENFSLTLTCSRGSKTPYIFNDDELVDVGELGVDKLPQRLLLVPVRL